MVLGIMESLEKVGDSIKEFLINADHNPFVWIGLFVLGLVVFFATYNALNKR